MLDKSTYKFFKKVLTKDNEFTFDAAVEYLGSKEEASKITYTLEKNNLIQVKQWDDRGMVATAFYVLPLTIAMIEQARKDRRRWIISIVIALAALIVSTISLLK
ncbi:MAG: hypothetical protein GX285_01605 [Clostridiales bacterium]|nr:hypothetical protein [Clostridiales bacterium]